ncbi:MAG TPA: DUF1566 domain-containing protein [Polyangia bacterium]|jgi:hypothetical protein
MTAGGIVLALALALAVRADPGAPPGRYQVTAETVLDSRTGLTWQRASAAHYDFADAKSYCAGLTLAGGGWRLPTVRELQTIVDEGAYAPAIDGAAFPQTLTLPYWSATPYVPVRGAWMVDFTEGRVEDHEVSDVMPVRCVR